MYYVYILKSLSFDKHYIGQTQNLVKRLEHHNSKRARWTKRFQPWNLIHFEEFSTRRDAMIREQKIKKIGDIKKFLVSVKIKESVI